MKRILPLILALVAGMAQADSNSDYRAGSDFAHQIKGQGSSSIQGFKPQESIPGYNANPDETKYYGGVTAGGDGGLKNDGTTEWATGETGKTITESFMNKPKDILSPDAPFIQTGRDVVNRADSIVGNTGQQCSAQEISRSEYTNYTCERDLQVEQYCTRTARMELQGSTTWETRTLEYEMSQLPAREVNGQYVVSITSPVTGEIVDAHYSWSRTYLQKSVPMTITVLGTPLSWNAKYSADASFTPVQKTLTAGVAFTSSHPVRVGNTKFKRHTAMKLRLVVRVKKASYTPYVVWSESCPFSKEQGKLTKTECTEAGGNRTLVKDGQSYSMYQSCWAYRDTYVTQSADKGTCQTYTDNPACTLVSHQCAFYSEEGACLHEYATYSCESKTSGKVMVCGGDVFCLDGECDKAQSGQSNDFAEAVSQLAALAAAGKDVAALNGGDVRAFTGQAKFCKKAAAGYSNCCKDSGWGQDIGLAKCSSDEKALAKAKSNKLTVSVGEFCSKKVLGVCLEKKRSYCQFDSKLAQIISMTLPDINAGCGGIDAYLGSFSFINGEQLQRFVKQIMSNAAGYFFDLALQTTVPEIKTAKDFVQKMASDINSMNLSSCQAAQGIIGGLFPRTQVSQQKVCQDIAGESNIFADWAASRQGCTVGGKSDSVRDKASDKDKERVTKNINIMWNALSKNRMFDGNKELKEFVMTLTGSLVFGPNGEITPLSARTTDRSIIRAMMEGGTAKIYHCNDSDKCLKVVADTPVTISRDNALKSQITKLLASIQNKAVSDTPLDDKEKGFISSTTIPVFKYLVDPQMLGVSNSMIYQLTDYIGYDILLQYIQELIQQARAMVATGNYDEAVIGHINDNMNDATRQIAAFQSQVQVQQDALLVVDRQMSYMRQQLSARMLSRYQNNYHFGGSTR